MLLVVVGFVLFHFVVQLLRWLVATVTCCSTTLLRMRASLASALILRAILARRCRSTLSRVASQKQMPNLQLSVDSCLCASFRIIVSLIIRAFDLSPSFDFSRSQMLRDSLQLLVLLLRLAIPKTRWRDVLRAPRVRRRREAMTMMRSTTKTRTAAIAAVATPRRQRAAKSRARAKSLSTERRKRPIPLQTTNKANAAIRKPPPKALTSLLRRTKTLAKKNRRPPPQLVKSVETLMYLVSVRQIIK